MVSQLAIEDIKALTDEGCTVSPEDVQEIHRWTQESGVHAGRGALSW